MSRTPVAGKYRHYKGDEYEVVDVGTHSETGEQLVAYRALYGDRALWFRPLEMFVEDVDHNGVRQPRFALLEPARDSPIEGSK